MLRGKVKRYMSEKITSVEDEILSYQEGQAASAINTAYTFIPCAIETPIGVILTPVKITDSANAIAFPQVAEVESFEVFSTVADLDDHAAAIDYEVGTVVEATLTGGTAKGYVCCEAHTSTAGPDFDADFALGYWEEANTENFLKINHVAAGATKVANFTYLINGYKDN